MTYRARLAKLEARFLTPVSDAAPDVQHAERALTFAIMGDSQTRAVVMKIYAKWARHQDAVQRGDTPDPLSWREACQNFFNESVNP